MRAMAFAMAASVSMCLVEQTSAKTQVIQTGWDGTTGALMQGWADSEGSMYYNQTEFRVGYYDSWGPGGYSQRGFVWFGIPSEIVNSTIESAKFIVTVSDLSEWNSRLESVELYGVEPRTFDDFRRNLSGMERYNALVGVNYQGRKTKAQTLSFDLIPSQMRNKLYRGFALRAYPEVPSGWAGEDITHQILLENALLSITYFGVVSTPYISLKPDNAFVGHSFVFEAGGSSCSIDGHSVQYRFDWGDGSAISSWGTRSRAHTYAEAGTFQLRAQAKCVDEGITSSWSSAESVVVAPHTVRKPSTPSGPSTGLVDADISFSTGGSSCPDNHSIQYKFDWGDGTSSSFGSSTQAKRYTSRGTYSVKSRAQCAGGYESVWSDGKTITISGPVISVSPASRDFGSQPVGASTTISGAFTVQNDGVGTLTGSATVSTPFEIVSGGSYSLGAGARQTVAVKFSPGSQGTFTRTVIFSGGGGATGTCTGAGTTVPSYWVFLGYTGDGVPSGGGTFAAGTEVTVTAMPNAGSTFVNWTEDEAVVSTSASYTFTLTGNRSLLANFAVVDTPVLSVTPPSQSVSTSSGSTTFAISNTGSGTMPWVVAVVSGGAWARITHTSGAGAFTVGYDANPAGGAARTATIRVTATGASGSPADVTVVQAANPGGGAGNAVRAVTGTSVSIALTPPTGTSAWGFEETIPAGLTPSGLTGPNANWNSTSRKITWYGTGAAAATLGYAVTGAAGTYTLTGAVNFNGADGTVSGVNQVVIGTPPPASVLTVTPASRAVGVSAGSTTFSVANTGSGTMPWTAAVVSGGTWARVTTGASGSNAGTITIGYDANPSGGAARTATIRVTATGASGSPADVTVVQAVNFVGLVHAITTPTTGVAWTSPTNRLNLAGTASGGTGAVSVVIRNSRDVGEYAATVSGSNWTFGGLPLHQGLNHIDVVARDANGSTSTATLVVTHNADTLYDGGLRSGQVLQYLEFPDSVPRGYTVTVRWRILSYVPVRSYLQTVHRINGTNVWSVRRNGRFVGEENSTWNIGSTPKKYAKVYTFETEWTAPDCGAAPADIYAWINVAQTDGQRYLMAAIPDGVDSRPDATLAKVFRRTIVPAAVPGSPGTPGVSNSDEDPFREPDAQRQFDTVENIRRRSGGTVTWIDMPHDWRPGTQVTCQWKVLGYMDVEGQLAVADWGRQTVPIEVTGTRVAATPTTFSFTHGGQTYFATEYMFRATFTVPASWESAPPGVTNGATFKKCSQIFFRHRIQGTSDVRMSCNIDAGVDPRLFESNGMYGRFIERDVITGADETP